MNTIESVSKAVIIFEKYNTPLALLHTTNLYPTPSNLVRLGAMTELSNAFPDKVFGLSDHTINNNACLAAVALGAKIIEKHFTLDRTLLGPDHAASLEPKELKAMVNAIRNI